jgi:hypothetical protein
LHNEDIRLAQTLRMCCAELTSTAQKQKKTKKQTRNLANETEQGIDTTSSSAFPYCCCAALLPQLTLHSKIT